MPHHLIRSSNYHITCAEDKILILLRELYRNMIWELASLSILPSNIFLRFVHHKQLVTVLALTSILLFSTYFFIMGCDKHKSWNVLYNFLNYNFLPIETRNFKSQRRNLIQPTFSISKAWIQLTVHKEAVEK